MNESFSIAATGMHAHQTQVDVIANNLSNVNTMGFKKDRVDFEDLLYRQTAAAAPSVLTAPDINNPRGSGTAVNSIGKVFTVGESKATNRDLDIAVQGDGFLELLMPDGAYAYTRMGALQINGDGMLVNADGFLLSPAVQIPGDAESILITRDGTVSVSVADSKHAVEIGRIELANFVNAPALTPTGNNLYVPSSTSGSVFYGQPGEDGMGQIAQGFLEGSNVNMIEELSGLMLAQRGYDINARVLQVADDMLSTLNALVR